MSDFFRTFTSSRSRLQERVEAAVLLAELDAEVGLVDAQARDHAAFLRGDGDGLVLGGDVLGGLEDRLHEELGGAAAGDAVERRADPAPLAPHGVALGALGLALEVEEEPPARLGIAGDVRLPGALARRAGQAADVGDQLADLVVLEGLAQLLHGGLGHAVPDDAGDVVIGAAVDPTAVGQVGALAAAAGPAVTAAAQAAEQRLAFRELRVFGGRHVGGCRWGRGLGRGRASPACERPRTESERTAHHADAPAERPSGIGGSSR